MNVSAASVIAIWCAAISIVPSTPISRPIARERAGLERLLRADRQADAQHSSESAGHCQLSRRIGNEIRPQILPGERAAAGSTSAID